MEQHGITINVILRAKRLGDYTVFIFENVANSELVCITKLPNWQGDNEINVGQDGFLTYVFINALVDVWKDANDNLISYKYSGNYYQSFIPNAHTVKDGEVVRKELLIK
jgi:hypothetical protein